MHKRGITLVELMISLGILMIISSLMLVVTGSGRISWTVAAAKLYVSSQARQASLVIQQELSLSEHTTHAIVASDNKSIRFNIPIVIASGTSEGSLDLESTGDLKWGDGATKGNWIEYFIPSGTTDLVKRVLDDSLVEVSGTRRVIARGVQNFSITTPAGTRQYLVTLDFSIDKYLGGKLPTPIAGTISFYVSPMN
jgi:Tfp pilus assembly major pilin PilA